ncbi:DNA-methyltransferase [Paraburkholderia sp. BCC1885]|uniref:DNA-methyltransferase n=1 Tax=Paraburkholderia sp. BCC1885 TaxID=2562669 RepID=UPI0021B26AFA|nr:site-specific DNA-methyltransferase [Paraburkholderia sp. BCC1885]
MMDWTDKCHFGDCRDLMAEMPEGIADACITDPPYGDTSLVWDRQCLFWIDRVARVLKPTASIWVFGSMRFLAPMFDDMSAAGFKYAQDIVWEKQNGSGLHNDRFRRVHEYAVQFYRGVWADVYKEPQFTQDATARTLRRKTRPTHFGEVAGSDATYSSEDGGPRLQRSVIYQANEHGKAFHPTQKPLGILAPLIAYSVPPGGVVLDPFLGSGSTAIAARQLGRHWIGCENDPASMAAQDERFRQSDMFAEPA